MGSIKAKTHLEKLGFSEADKKKPDHDKIQTWVYENIDTIIAETVMCNNKHPYKITEVRWEHQIIYQSGTYRTIVGFIDIMISLEGRFYYKNPVNDDDYETKNKVFIEVKTEIPSLGELIRQMRAYQSYEGTFTYYLIVSPDDRHKKILNEQGFLFYKYKNPNQLF